MRLAKLSEFRRLIYTEASAPRLATLRERIRAGKIPGGRIEFGQFWVDLDEFDRATNLRQRLAAERDELARDPRLKGLI